MRPEHWLFTIPLRLRSLFRWTQANQELDDELRDHFERKPRCAGRSRDAAHGSDACTRRAFRRFPFDARRYHESNPGDRFAIADWTPSSACGNSPLDHRSFAAA